MTSAFRQPVIQETFNSVPYLPFSDSAIYFFFSLLFLLTVTGWLFSLLLLSPVVKALYVTCALLHSYINHLGTFLLIFAKVQFIRVFSYFIFIIIIHIIFFFTINVFHCALQGFCFLAGIKPVSDFSTRGKKKEISVTLILHFKKIFLSIFLFILLNSHRISYFIDLLLQSLKPFQNIPHRIGSSVSVSVRGEFFVYDNIPSHPVSFYRRELKLIRGTYTWAPFVVRSSILKYGRQTWTKEII